MKRGRLSFKNSICGKITLQKTKEKQVIKGKKEEIKIFLNTKIENSLPEDLNYKKKILNGDFWLKSKDL